MPVQTRQHASCERSPRAPRWQAVGLGALLIAAGAAPGAAHGADGNPARLHTGSCEELGAVAFPLTGVGASVDLEDAPLATPTAVNADQSTAVAVSETTIEAPLEAILGSEYAVMVYASDEDMSGIACGNVGGAMVDDRLVTGLTAFGQPGIAGFALFEPDGEQTVVTILLGQAGDGEEGEHEDAVPHDETGTPAAEATPHA